MESFVTPRTGKVGRSVRGALASCAIVGGIALGSAVPAFAAPAVHDSEPASGVFVCGDRTYTVTGGTLKFAGHEGTSASGNTNATFTLVPVGVTLTDGTTDTVYRLAGALWDGETSNARTGAQQGTFTAHFTIIASGQGVVGNVSMTAHFSSDGKSFSFDRGSCQLPPD